MLDLQQICIYSFLIYRNISPSINLLTNYVNLYFLGDIPSVKDYCQIKFFLYDER